MHIDNPELGRDTMATLPIFVHIGRTLREWHHRNRSRRELAGLGIIDLSDIACTEAEARRESVKWFWQA